MQRPRRDRVRPAPGGEQLVRRFQHHQAQAAPQDQAFGRKRLPGAQIRPCRAELPRYVYVWVGRGWGAGARVCVLCQTGMCVGMGGRERACLEAVWGGVEHRRGRGVWSEESDYLTYLIPGVESCAQAA